MNRNQQIAIGIGAAAVFVMLIFPPFHLQVRDAISSMGYAFILDPPKQGRFTAVVDSGLLAVQWLGVLVLTALAVLMLNKPDRPARGGATHKPLNPQTQSDERSAGDAQISGMDHFHPWRRLFARTIDGFIFGLIPIASLLAAAETTLAPDVPSDLISRLENPIVASFLAYMVWLPTEAVLLSKLGSTPGKWLFGINVTDNQGMRLSFSNALRRALSVWVVGIGFGIPIVAQIACLFAYFDLKRTGVTTWDKSTNAIVKHHDPGILRTLASVAALLAVFAVYVILYGAVNYQASRPSDAIHPAQHAGGNESVAALPVHEGPARNEAASSMPPPPAVVGSKRGPEEFIPLTGVFPMQSPPAVVGSERGSLSGNRTAVPLHEHRVPPGDTVIGYLSGSGAGFVVQVGSFSKADNADSVKSKLAASGFPAFVETIGAGGKQIYRVKVGPRPSREAADDLRQKLIDNQGIDGIITTHP